MKNIKFPHPKKVDIFNLKKPLPKRKSIELELELKLAKAGFKGFY